MWLVVRVVEGCPNLAFPVAITALAHEKGSGFPLRRE